MGGVPAILAVAAAPSGRFASSSLKGDVTMADDDVKFYIGYDRGAQVMPVPLFAPLAEKLGYDGITLGGSQIGLGGGYDPFVVLSQAAAATERLLLVTSVLLLPLVHPILLAQQAATLDRLSQGRVILGVGIGGERSRQFVNLGIPLNERGVRSDEALEILKGLWTQPSFSYKGRVFQFDDISMEVRPFQKPHIPLWIGGRIGGVEIGPDGKQRFKSKTATLRRTARYGDGWFPFLMTAEAYRKGVQDISAMAKDYGRGGYPFTLACNFFWSVGDDYEEALEAAAAGNRQGGHRKEFSAKYDIVGTPKDCVKRIREFVDVGLRHVVVKPLRAQIRGQGEAVLEQAERVAKEVMPYFK